MGYEVRFVGNGSLPAGVEWVFARTHGETYLFVSMDVINASTGRCDSLCRAWAAWEKVERQGLLAQSA